MTESSLLPHGAQPGSATGADQVGAVCNCLAMRAVLGPERASTSTTARRWAPDPPAHAHHKWSTHGNSDSTCTATGRATHTGRVIGGSCTSNGAGPVTAQRVGGDSARPSEWQAGTQSGHATRVGVDPKGTQSGHVAGVGVDLNGTQSGHVVGVGVDLKCHKGSRVAPSTGRGAGGYRTCNGAGPVTAQRVGGDSARPSEWQAGTQSGHATRVGVDPKGTQSSHVAGVGVDLNGTQSGRK